MTERIASLFTVFGISREYLISLSMVNPSLSDAAFDRCLSELKKKVGKAYKKKALSCHPDRWPGKDAEFKQLSDNYKEILVYLDTVTPFNFTIPDITYEHEHVDLGALHVTKVSKKYRNGTFSANWWERRQQ